MYLADVKFVEPTQIQAFTRFQSMHDSYARMDRNFLREPFRVLRQIGIMWTGITQASFFIRERVERSATPPLIKSKPPGRIIPPGSKGTIRLRV